LLGNEILPAETKAPKTNLRREDRCLAYAAPGFVLPLALKDVCLALA